MPSETNKPIRPVEIKMFNRGYVALLATQFLGAANDNIVKMVITNMVVAGGIWFAFFKDGGGTAIPAICLTVPFILLSGYAGQFADRFSKRSIMVGVKLAEIPLAFIALVGFWTQNFGLALVSLTFLGVQSTMFGPSKFGSIPELVGDTYLSPANGLINMLSNLGVIGGVLLAGPLSDVYNPDPAIMGENVKPLLWAPGLAAVIVALCGLGSIMMMPKLAPKSPNLRFDWNPFGTYFRSLKEMGTGPLFVVICAWSGFYMVGSMALLIIPEYKAVFEITYTKSTMLLVVLSVSIAIGSVSAGIISGKTIRPALIPVGALGMTVCFLLMGLITPTYGGVAVLLAVAGVSAGLYIVPLQALIQYLSPSEERGRFLGTASAMSFVFITLGALIVYLATNGFGLVSWRVNLICAGLALIGFVVGVMQMKRVMAGKSKIVTPGMESE